MSVKTRQILILLPACLFGAGFISGQELWQFFGICGNKSLLYITIASIILGILAFMTIHIASALNISEPDRIIVPFKNKIIIRLVGIIELSFYVCIFIIMMSGAGTLIENVTGSKLARILFSLFFCFFVVKTSIKGINNAVKFFDLIVPIMVIVAVIISTAILLKSSPNNLTFNPIKSNNPLLSNPIISMLIFVSYNFFCSSGTFAMLGKQGVSTKNNLLGCFLGTVIILSVSLILLTALTSLPASKSAEIPLLFLAETISSFMKYVVCFTLLIAMLGASISVFIPIPEYFKALSLTKKHENSYTIIIATASLILSLFKFSNLIAVIYPIYGYIAFAAILGTCINFVKTIRNNKKSRA